MPDEIDNEIEAERSKQQQQLDHETAVYQQWRLDLKHLASIPGRPIDPFILMGVAVPGQPGQRTPNQDFSGLDHWTFFFAGALQGVATKKTGVEQAIERAERIADMACQALERRRAKATQPTPEG